MDSVVYHRQICCIGTKCRCNRHLSRVITTPDITEEDLISTIKVLNNIGALVYVERTRRNMGQKRCAEEMGVHSSSLSTMENAYRYPTLPMMLKAVRWLKRSRSTIRG